MVAPLVAAALIGGASALVGGGISAYGQHKANRENIAHSREQMAFQERMSSTAYQRAMLDMKQSGLNPSLAYNQGGASTPTGSQPPGSKNKFENAVSALSLMRLAVDVQEASARTEVLKKDVELKGASAKKVIQDTRAGAFAAERGSAAGDLAAGVRSGITTTAKGVLSVPKAWYDFIDSTYKSVRGKK